MDYANIKLTFRNMDHSKVIDDYVNKQILKLDKFLKVEPIPIFIHLVLEVHPTHSFYLADLMLKTPNYDLVSHRERSEIYSLIDEVIDTMLSELLKAKGKKVDSKIKPNKN